MSVKKAILAVLGGVAAQVTFAATGSGFYVDSFEGSQFSDMGTNYRWVGGAWNFVASGVAKDGAKAMRFGYPPGWNTSAEERFAFSKPHPEVWIRYWFRVPTNFQHMTRSGMASNNKLFALWMDDYSAHGDGPSVVWEYWDNGKGGSELAVHYSAGQYTGCGEHKAFTPFINTATDKGRWMQIVLHVKAASARGKGDGLIETYRRWENESTYTNIQRVTGADIAPSPAAGQPQGWQGGYFMGWSNPGFDVQTDFYIDNVEVADYMDISQTQSVTIAPPPTGGTSVVTPPSTTQGDPLSTPTLKSATVK